MDPYYELKSTVKVRCPLSKEVVTYDTCHACQIEHLPDGCWDASDVIQLLEILIDERMWGSEATGIEAVIKMELVERIEVIE